MKLNKGHRGLLLVFLIVLMTVPAVGCIKHQPRLEKTPAIVENTFETDPAGMAMDVVSVNWTYFNSGSHIRVTGVVRNNTGQPQQAVTLHGVVSDENGGYIMSGRSFVAPTYLAPGAEGEFEFVGIVKPGQTNIKFIHVVTQARVLG